MDDFEEIPVRTSAGDRPPSMMGDRLLLGLAALALAGGLLIAAGNLLARDTDETAAGTSQPPQTSATSGAARSARPTPTERPLREVTLEPGEPDQQAVWVDVGPFRSQHWVRTAADLVVRARPDDGAPQLATLAAGAVGLGSWDGDRPEASWFRILAPHPLGWIRLRDDAGALLGEVRPVAHGELGGRVRGLTAGPSGFVADVWTVSTTPGPWPVQSGTAFSPDGERWRFANGELAQGVSLASAAWGPAGWLGAVTLDNRASAWLFESADGARWVPIGSLRTRSSSGFVERLVGSGQGYMLALGRGGPGRPDFWYSPDGITWQESSDPFPRLPRVAPQFELEHRVLASDVGFFAWEHLAVDAPPRPPMVAFSSNGRTWSVVPADDGPAVALHLATAGDRLLALARGEEGSVLAWRAGFESGAYRLAREPRWEESFAGSTVTALTSDGTTAYAFGYDTSDGRARAWVTDGEAWRALSVPESGFGSVVIEAAAGPAGVVVAGAQLGEHGAVPLLWHLRAGGAWFPEARPIAGDPDPSEPRTCGAPPESAFEFVSLEQGTALRCLGGQPITFTAWSASCRACRDLFGQPPELHWLRDYTRDLNLLPYADRTDDDIWRVVRPASELELSEAWTDAWLRVTGHYDDTASSECGRPDSAPYWEGPEIETWRCRTTFVVTEVTVVDGPEPTAR